MLVEPASLDVAVEAPPVELSIIRVSVPGAPPVSVGEPGAAVVPVPIEVLNSHPEELVESGMDIVPPVYPRRAVLATVPVGPVHWPVLDGTASTPDPMAIMFSPQSSACAKCRFSLSWS